MNFQKSKKAFLPMLLFFYFCSFLHNDLCGIKMKNPGYKYFKNYSYLEYDHHPQNLCIVQDKKGIIYVGNLGGVLIYDGLHWQQIDIPNMLVRSMAIGKDGYIYIGGKDEFGYLAPNSKGFMEYHSLKKKLDPQYGNISEVYNTIATEEGVYFRTRNLLFSWNYKKINFYKKGNFLSLFHCNRHIIIQQSKLGLMKFKKELIIPLEGSGTLGNEKIWMLVTFNTKIKPDNFLLATWSKGLLIYKNKTLVPFKTEADNYLRENKISHGIRLSNGDFAIGTFYGGVVFLNRLGNIKYTFSKKSGLQNNNVKFVMEDNIGGVWMALLKGISRLEYQSPFYQYDNRLGLEGMAFTVIRHKNNIYVGSSQGLFELKEEAKTFEKVAGISTCWDLLSIEKSLLAATDTGIFQIDSVESNHHKIHNKKTFGIISSKSFPHQAWCVSEKGLLAIIKKNDNWTLGDSVNEINTDIRDIIEEPSGRLWLLSAKGTLLRVAFPFGLSQPKISQYNLEGKFYEEDIFLAFVEGHVVFASRKGLFRYDEIKNSFIPDMTLGKDFAYGPKSKPVFRIVQDNARNIWFHSKSRNYWAIPLPDGSFKIIDKPFRRIPIIQMNCIYPDTNGSNIWFAGSEGLIKFDLIREVRLKTDFTAIVRDIIVNEATPLFGGYSYNPKSPRLVPQVSFQNRNFIFACAAPFFEREKEILFSYKLDGFSNNWSEWTAESQKYFTNLDAGEYTFHTRAKNIYGTISEEDSFSFRILPPWYRTWWAIVLFTLGFLLVFFLLLMIFVKRHSRKLIRENERLEQVVSERTKEVRDKNNQLEQQTLQLQEQSEKLKEMDEIKSRFFANISHEFRTPLTLIMSPLEQMLSKVQDKAQKKKYRLMLRNSQQLLTLINQLLDLSRLDSGKLKLQAAKQNIFPLLKDAYSAFRAPCKQKQLTLVFISKIQPMHSLQEEEHPPILIYFDYDKMEEVIYNLLSNAFKFTPPGGKITLSLSRQQQNICISVQDTGKGIPQHQLENIFDRFYQASDGAKTVQGTGIGLALVKEIIMLHHGEIEVNSQEGKGTEFVVRLPLGKSHLTEEQIVSISGTTSQRNREGETIASRIQSENDSNEEQVHTENDNLTTMTDNGYISEKVTILVVEDHKDMREHIRGFLETEYDILEAVNGKEGIAKAKEIIPDLIISDIMMPEISGYELCRVLKKDIKTSHIPIILLTAKASEKNIIKGLETGADDYVTKPFNSEILLARIQNLIDIRQQMQKKIQREKMLLPAEIQVSNQDDLFLKEFQSIVEKKLDNEDFNIDALCKELLISRAALFKKIQALTGETPNQFIQSYRLERGAQLLRENYGNITEVAMAVGFSSSQYFAKLFKEKFHITPKAYQASESK